MLRPGPHQVEVLSGSGTATVGCAAPFGARATSLAPGHLVAVTESSGAGPLVLWRWYDAVVLEQTGDQVRLWEPGHGEVLATPRHPERRYPPGTRAYASAGLPGAEWWVEGPVTAIEEVDVALDSVCAFYAEHGLWDRLV